MSETIQMKDLEVTASLKIPQQHFRASIGLAVKFMHHKALAVCWRIPLVQKFPHKP
jgi:hypothetical protein